MNRAIFIRAMIAIAILAGVVFGFQNCSGHGQGAAATLPVNYISADAKPLVGCTPAASKDCDGDNGSGKQVCNSTGTGFSECKLNSCEKGYGLVDGSCEEGACNSRAVAVDGSILPIPVENSKTCVYEYKGQRLPGRRFCKSDGSFGDCGLACTLVSDDAGVSYGGKLGPRYLCNGFYVVIQYDNCPYWDGTKSTPMVNVAEQLSVTEVPDSDTIYTDPSCSKFTFP